MQDLSLKRFEQLAYPLSKDLYRLAYSRVGSPEDAEDLTQEAFIKAFRAFHTFKEGSNFKAWMVRILINTITDHIRQSKRQPDLVYFDDSDSAPDLEELARDDRQPDAELIRDEIDPLLMQALRALPQALAAPLLLRELQEFSYKDISEALNIPMGTVMSRLSRARQFVKTKLQKLGFSRSAAAEASPQ